MNLKRTSIFLIPMMMAALCFSNASKVSADATELNVQAFNGTTSATTNTINPKIKLTNMGNSPINLSDLKLRYYFTEEGTQQQGLWCDYASLVSSSGYMNETNNITGTFEKLSKSTADADSYFEISFTKDTLPANGTLELQLRVSKADWSNYNQANDYSFNPSATQYTDWNKITAYVGGKLIYGVEPSNAVVTDSTISPTEASFDKNSPSDLATNITFNGNTLREIDNGASKLQQDSDYTLSGNTVTISKSYLASLSEGVNTLTFKFNLGDDAALKVLVKPLNSMNIAVGNVQASDNASVNVDFLNINKQILGSNLSISYDASQLELVSVTNGDIVKDPQVNFAYDASTAGRVNIFFCDESFGTNLITSNGTFARLTFKVKGTSSVITPLTVSDEAIADINGDIIPASIVNGSVSINK